MEPAIRAAGGVVWRNSARTNGDAKVEIAIIHRPRYDDWSIPKGKLAPGESEIEGAVREVFEETGFRIRLGRPLGHVRYMKATGDGERPKIVRYWAMQAESGCFTPNREVDELRWVSFNEAQELLTHEHDLDVLQRFVRGPVLTGCVLLVRHASAGSRTRWEGDDRARPLDDIGWRQATELVRLLSRFEVETVVAADFVRCTQTVEPLADALGLKVVAEAVFSEVGYSGHETDAVARIRELGASLETAVVCSQGDVIPDLLQRLAAEDDVDLPDAATKKGSVWALNFEGPRLFSAEHFPPPAIA